LKAQKKLKKVKTELKNKVELIREQFCKDQQKIGLALEELLELKDEHQDFFKEVLSIRYSVGVSTRLCIIHSVFRAYDVGFISTQGQM
jgi:hypothetical protein